MPPQPENNNKLQVPCHNCNNYLCRSCGVRMSPSLEDCEDCDDIDYDKEKAVELFLLQENITFFLFSEIRLSTALKTKLTS